MTMVDKLLNRRGRKESRMTTLAVIMISVSFFLTTCLSVWSISRQERENGRAITEVIAGRIYDAINSELTKPIMVAQGMANNSFLIDAIADEKSRPEADNVERFRRYLYTVKEYMHYDTAFVVSDASRRYYTYKGLNKVIDTKNDEHDIWYKLFVDGEKKYDLDVDLDEVNGKRWTVFVNARISDSKGDFLGACGVGVRMDRLQDVFEGFERQYGIKINMINPKGLVQIDTDTVRIENAYLTNAPIGRKQSKES